MGLKRVSSGVRALVGWVEKDRKNHRDIPIENYLISFNVANESYLRFFHLPVVKGVIKYSVSDFVLNETSRSLYILPPMFPPYASSRTIDMAERAGDALLERGFLCEVESGSAFEKKKV